MTRTIEGACHCGAVSAKRIATLNMRGMGLAAGRHVEPATYDHESLEAKRARRLSNWTPLSLVAAGE